MMTRWLLGCLLAGSLVASGSEWLFASCTTDAECESLDLSWPWDASGGPTR